MDTGIGVEGLCIGEEEFKLFFLAFVGVLTHCVVSIPVGTGGVDLFYFCLCFGDLFCFCWD